MSPLTLILLAIFLQWIISSGKIILEGLFLEEETGYYIENVLSLLLVIAFFFLLSGQKISPVSCWFYSILFTIFSFISSWSIAQGADFFFGWGEDTHPLSPIFPIIASWLLFFVFLPFGLEEHLGLSQFLEKAGSPLLWILLGEFSLVSLLVLVNYYFDQPLNESILDYSLHLVLAMIFFVWNSETMGAGQSWLFTTILVLAANVQAAGLFYIAYWQMELGEAQEGFWKKRVIIFSLQILAVLGCYVFPILGKAIRWINHSLDFF